MWEWSYKYRNEFMFWINFKEEEKIVIIIKKLLGILRYKLCNDILLRINVNIYIEGRL